MPDINSMTLHIGEKLVIFSEGGDLVMVRGAENMSILSVVAGNLPPTDPLAEPEPEGEPEEEE